MESSKTRNNQKQTNKKTEVKTMHHNERRQRTETISERNLMWNNQGLWNHYCDVERSTGKVNNTDEHIKTFKDCMLLIVTGKSYKSKAQY